MEDVTAVLRSVFLPLVYIMSDLINSCVFLLPLHFITWFCIFPVPICSAWTPQHTLWGKINRPEGVVRGKLVQTRMLLAF
ncbi:hypothetical protein GDO78_016251 [Eleutherodactylus coqui]|uniref:Uncharacterized protein n=1 Tax=Eleutherodactylus coqui TaxID=57060 RepID=A0A8J6BF38_ELECQ|nr:hypothetical protein GDO78_016251 [Eleutherodactylus coqui]